MHHPIRVGIVGASPDRGPGTNAHLPWARVAHIPAIQALPDFELRAVATTKTETALAAAKAFGADHGFGNAMELIRHAEVDLVVISVRVPYHYDLACAAIEAGKHVYCEWPLALTTAQAADLAARAERRGIRHVVGLQARAAPTFNYVKDLISQGYVGEVLSVNVNFAVPTWGSRVEAPVAYLHDKANGATLLDIYGGHSLDVLCHVLGEFREFSALVESRYTTVKIIETGEVRQKTAPDQVAISGILQSGAVVSYHLQGGVTNLRGVVIEIRGDQGDLVVTAEGNIEASPLELRGAKAKHDTSVAVEYGDVRALEPLPIPPAYRHMPQDVGEGPPLNVGELYVQLADAIRGKAPTSLPGFDVAVQRHRLLDAVSASATSGQRFRMGPSS